MGIMKQANKLKGEAREKFLQEHYETLRRLKEAQKPPAPKKQRKPKKPQNGKVIARSIADLEDEHFNKFLDS